MPPKLPPKQRTKLVRLSAGTLLNAQKATTKRIQAAVKLASAQALLEIQRRQADDRRRKAALLAALLLLSRQMADHTADAITESRQHARREGARRLVAELVAAGIVLAPYVVGSQNARSVMLSGAGLRREQDAAHAVTSADSLAATWRARMFHAVTRADREDASITDAIDDAADSMSQWIDRTAETETAQAYNDERTEALEDALRLDQDFADTMADSQVMREWVAMLDACRFCWPHDGEQVPYDAPSFSDGDIPGDMHPRCRCFDTIVVVPSALETAA